MAKRLTPPVRDFVHEYVWGEDAGNAGKCALRVKGWKLQPTSSRTFAYHVLRRPHVKVLVDAQTAEKEALLKQKAARVAEETFALAVARVDDLFMDDGKSFKPVSEWPIALRRALASIETMTTAAGLVVTKVKLHDKRAAQELFLKYAGKLKDKVEIEGKSIEDLVLAADRLFRARPKAGKPE